MGGGRHHRGDAAGPWSGAVGELRDPLARTRHLSVDDPDRVTPGGRVTRLALQLPGAIRRLQLSAFVPASRAGALVVRSQYRIIQRHGDGYLAGDAIRVPA